MNHPLSSRARNSLVCSNCGSDLEDGNLKVTCSGCRTEFPFTSWGSLDMRLKKPKTYPMEIELGVDLPPDRELQFPYLSANPAPEVDFSNLESPTRLTRAQLSHFPKASATASLMLDLGCGDGLHRKVCEHAGFEWIGLDVSGTAAPVLGDAHALPFRNDTFEFLLSVAVLEHVRYPLVMMREAYRVLKPGGKFLGSVAFLEPFHESLYHHSHWAVFNSLQYGGFTIDRISAHRDWSGLKAMAGMELFPKMPLFLTELLVMPLEMAHQLWWKLASLLRKKNLEDRRIRHTTGAFTFVAYK